MRVLILYASDLRDPSDIAPGGITGNVRSYAAQLPDEWNVEVWGADCASHARHRTERVGRRSVNFRAITRAEPVAQRRHALNPRFAMALARRAWCVRLAGAFDVIVSHRTEYLAALALTQPRSRLPAMIQMIHGSSAWSGRAFHRGPELAYLAGERLAVRLADAIALVADSTLAYYRQRYPAQASKVVAIPNGVDLSRFRRADAGQSRELWRHRFGFGPDDRVLVYHGRYDPEKGIGRMLDVLRHLRQDGQPWRLLVAGDGSLKDVVRDAERASGGTVRHAGRLGADEIPGFLSAGDLALLCSDFEGLSNGLLESLAAGLPVIATPVGDSPTVLGGVDPGLTPGLDAASLAAAVRDAWPRRGELGVRARAVAEQYSLARRARRIASLIVQTANARAGTPHAV